MLGLNFTENVRRILALAREEAARLHHEYVGTEHIVLGLVSGPESTGIHVIRALGADPEAIQRRAEKVVRAGRASATPGPDLPYTSRSKMVLELMMKEAAMLGHSFVGSEHLLLGLLAEGKGIAAQVLTEAGITLDAARSELVRLTGTGPSSVASHPGAPLGTLRTPVDRVDLILHYRDGRRFQSSFPTAEDAVAFLRSASSKGEA